MKREKGRHGLLAVLLAITLVSTPLVAQEMPIEQFAERRHALMENLGDDAIAIFKSPPQLLRNSDIMYPYRQNSDFYYLSGFEEPGSVLLLLPGTETPFILFAN